MDEQHIEVVNYTATPASPLPEYSTKLDETYAIYKEIDPQEARSVLRSIDWHIMPLLMGT